MLIDHLREENGVSEYCKWRGRRMVLWQVVTLWYRAPEILLGHRKSIPQRHLSAAGMV